MHESIHIRNMSRAEVDELVAWAAAEGWNPGLHDADIFWQTDPEAFIAAELNGELIGGGAITSYDGRFGFMGFFIVKPEYRGHGYGDTLWHWRKDHLLQRLSDGAAIGMDGVFNMQPYYARGGFEFSHRDVRFQGMGVKAGSDASIVDLKQVPFNAVIEFDTRCFPVPRARFLQAWIHQADSLALGSLQDNHLNGYGVIRRCGTGCKIGPLFAENHNIAEKLFTALGGFAPGEAIFLDVPENNPDAVQLAGRHDMQEVFGCARMYLGPKPILQDECIYGVTTFELG